MLLPPPPQEAIITVAAASRSRQIPRIICFLSAMNTMENNIPTASIQPETPCNGCCRLAAVVGAVVLTVTVAVVVETTPFAFRDAGENEHVASEGNPEQASAMVPLKLVELEIATEVAPVPPGLVMATAGLPDKIMKNPGVMVNVRSWVEVLALKLGSPA